MQDDTKKDAWSAETKRNAEIEALRILTGKLLEEGRSLRAKRQQIAVPPDARELHDGAAGAAYADGSPT